MALPLKQKKNIKLKQGILNNGPKEWIDQFLGQNKNFLPRSVHHADLDSGFVEFVGKDLSIIIEGKEVPVNFLTLQRWNEFSKTWPNNDQFKNIKIPFISVVRKPDAQPGTNPAGAKIAERKTFDYMRIPIWDGNRKGIDIYKIPQPVGVDITYTVRFFTYKMRSKKISK